MNKVLAFLWLIIIGTNAAEIYSMEAPYQGAVIVLGTLYFSFVYRAELLRLFFYKDFILVLFALAAPLLLMLFSDRSFERGTYTSQLALALVFVVATVLASRTDLDRALTNAAFVIVAVGAALNLYELFIDNNLWSIAPGRSAGFYINPNISAEVLLGFGLAFLTARVGKLRISDLILIALVIVGVFATFSRAGILAVLVLLPAATLWQVRPKHVLRVVAGVLPIALLGIWFGSYVFLNLGLSEDATIRILSLIESGGIGDYGQDRGLAASVSLELGMQKPLVGMGVGTVYEMPEGPHNMFLGMLVDYGMVGLAFYLFIIVRLILVGVGAERKLSRAILLYVAWLVIFSFSSHNLLGNPSSIPLLGFALARAYQIQLLRVRRELSDAFA